jgi:hypothetical protein
VGGRPGRGVHMGLERVRFLTGGCGSLSGPVAVVGGESVLGLECVGISLLDFLGRWMENGRWRGFFQLMGRYMLTNPCTVGENTF